MQGSTRWWNAAAAAGLEGIEWGADVHVPAGDRRAVRHAVASCTAAGVEIPSYGSYVQPDTVAAEVDAVMATAADLGAEVVRIWTPFGVQPGGDAEQRREIVAGVARVATAAARRNLAVALEFHGWTLTHTAASAVQLLREVDAPNLFTYWQPVYWVEELADDVNGQLAELGAVLPDLAHVHVYWWRGLDRHPLADGAEIVRPALDLAASEGRWPGERYAFLEFVTDDDPANLITDAKTLRAWLGGPAAR